jgi:hypothetical protein
MKISISKSLIQTIKLVQDKKLIPAIIKLSKLILYINRNYFSLCQVSLHFQEISIRLFHSILQKFCPYKKFVLIILK